MTPIILSAPLTIEAAAQSGGDKPRRFRVDAYGGGVVPGYTAKLDQGLVIDLATLSARNGSVIANLDHDPKQRVGHVTDIENDGKTLKLGGTVSAATAAATEFLDSSRQGFPWSASIEAELPKLERLEKGKTAVVNGQTITGPSYVARGAKLTGISFVSTGADASARAFAASHRGQTMTHYPHDPELTAQLDACATAHLAREREMGLLHEPANVTVSASAAAEIEMRCQTAASGVTDSMRRFVLLAGKQALEGRISRDEFDREVGRIEASDRDLRDMRASRASGISSIPVAHTVFGRGGNSDAVVMEAALAQAAGIEVEKHYPDRVLQAAHDAFHGRLGIGQLLLMAANANGLQIGPGERINSGNLRRILSFALPEDGPVQMKAGFSTTALSGILSNVANKSLLMGWAEGDQTWRLVSQIKPVSDFKAATSYRMLDSLEYEELGPAGEIKHGTLSEETYTRQAKTYAKMLALTRTDIINDDLGAFNDLRVRIGRGAIQKFNNIFWAAFMNNASWFTSGHGNYIEGATTTLLTDGVGLQAAVLKFRQMTSSDGKRLDGEPALLLVPPELEFAARRLFQSTNVVATGDTDAVQASDNVFFGLYRPIVQTRLSDSAFTGNSATAWFLLRNPAIAAVVVASFLGGRQQPIVESSDADFDTLGIAFRGYHDFGVDQTVDYPAGVKSKGAV